MTGTSTVILCILDGWGASPDGTANAPALADTPTFDTLMATCPSAQLLTHGRDAGLPTGQMGNSEVGHTNIGAGRVVAMDLGQIDLAIEDESFFENAPLNTFAASVKAKGGRAHLMGVVSDGGVHGHIDHIIAACEAMARSGVEVLLHAVTDGRDVAPSSAAEFVDDLMQRLPQNTTVATVSGRYYAMDRDNRWGRVEQAYRAMVNGTGERAATAMDAVSMAAARGETDEFILPTVISDYAGASAGDGFFCLNFRADRARQILLALHGRNFEGFDIRERIEWSQMLGMVDYSNQHSEFMATAYPKQKILNTLGEWVASQGKRQFRLAETEKYPHVTFFLNGGREQPFEGEERHMPQSPRVATYDLAPEMAAAEVADSCVRAIKDGFDLIVVNFANPDMVGHTGDLQAAMQACQAVDRGLALIVQALQAVGGAMIVTADHGNCETMIDPETGGPHTAHTLNPVPVVLVGTEHTNLNSGRLADLAPTILALMGLPQPPEMTGVSLLK